MAQVLFGLSGKEGSELNQLSGPFAICFSEGYMFILDYNIHRVLMVRIGEKTGVVIFGGNGKGAALNQLNDARCLTVLGKTLLVSDSWNHRLLAIEI